MHLFVGYGDATDDNVDAGPGEGELDIFSLGMIVICYPTFLRCSLCDACLFLVWLVPLSMLCM